MAEWRRDRNKNCIQPNQIDTDEPKSKETHQSTHIYKNITQHVGLIEVVMLLCAIIIPLSVQAGILSFADENSTSLMGTSSEVVRTGSVLEVPVLTAYKNADPMSARGGGEVIVQDGALVSTGPVGEDVIATTRRNTGEISVYTVRPGDSLSQIAEMFGVTTNTILWANDLQSATSIQPGDSLVILPVAGVRHVVKTGDTLSSLATKYDADSDEIVAYNQITEGELVVGDTLVIPGGAIAAPPAPARVAATSGGASSAGSGSSFAHPVPGAIKTQGIHGYNAVDFAAGVGTSIRAAAAGEVMVSRSAGWNGGYGQYIVVRHADGSQSLYAHLSRNDVGVGAYVNQGEVIGAMGNTGRSTGPHLHFEIRGARNPF